MIIDFRMAVEGDRLRVSVPQAGLEEDVRHLAACWTGNGRIRTLGLTPEEMRAASPDDWERTGQQTLFLAPFSVEGFDRGLALVVIRLYVARAVQALRPGALGLVISGLRDSIRYDLHLPDFARLPESERQALIQGLNENAPHVRELRINGLAYTP